MDIYHVWCNLRPGVRDLDFVDALRAYLDHLEAHGDLRTYRITRAKLGLKPPQLRDFHVTLEFDHLGHMQQAFDRVSSREDPVEGLHHCVNALVQDVYFALYRDFPDATRGRGQERF